MTSADTEYTNPVINSDFPDPNCIQVNATYYVFATNLGEMHATTSHIQLATSRDLVHYQLQPDALPRLPQWAKPGRTWAPNVTQVQDKDGNSMFVLYFVAWDIQSDRQAIGVATCKNPEGPYESLAPRPFILQVWLPSVTPAACLPTDCQTLKCFSCPNMHTQHTVNVILHEIGEKTFPQLLQK